MTQVRLTWLDVTVQDVLGMALRQRAQHGTHVGRHRALCTKGIGGEEGQQMNRHAADTRLNS